MNDLPQNMKDKGVPLILEHLDPVKMTEELELLPHHARKVCDKLIYAFSLGCEFGYISCAENLSERVQEVFPETQEQLKDVFKDYQVGKVS